MIITRPTMLIPSGSEPVRNCLREPIEEKLFLPKISGRRSTQLSGVEVGCSNKPLRNGQRNSKPQMAEFLSSEGRQFVFPNPYPTARMNRGSGKRIVRSEEHTSELQSLRHLVCRLLLEKKKYRSSNCFRR